MVPKNLQSKFSLSDNQCNYLLRSVNKFKVKNVRTTKKKTALFKCCWC